MPKQLFIALSTGQNIANVLPLLERAQPTDRIMWLESPLAAAQGWSNAAMQLLGDYGYAEQRRHAIGSDDLAAVAATVHAVLAEHADEYQPVFIANGGTKLQALAAYVRPDLPVLYSLDRPCAYEWYPHGIGEQGERHRYQHHRLDLDAVLQLRGMERKDTDAQCLWGNNAQPLEPTWYGQDEQRTVELHDRHHARSLQRVEAHQTLPRDQLWAAVRDSQQEGLAKLRGQLRAWAGRNPSDGLLQNIALSSRKLFEQAVVSKQRQATTTLPLQPLGELFEQAVAQRTVEFLRGNPQVAAAVQSVWLNAKAGKRGAEQPVAMETDILIVLKNGILLHIECKSHKAENKDLDARLLNLQNASSLLAKMAVCSPCYTQYSDKPWFVTQHEFKQRVQNLQAFTWLPFELLGQPAHYCLPQETQGRQYTCGTFAEELAKLFKPFIG